MVTVNVARGAGVTLFALGGMLVGFYVQDVMLRRKEVDFAAKVEASVAQALADKRRRVEGLEARARQLADEAAAESKLS